jgi:hypothetical protein
VLATFSPEITWVAIDPGDSRYSPQHIESVILEQARTHSITIQWLATVPLTDGESRYGFVIGSQSALEGLSAAICTALGQQSSVARADVIHRVLNGVEGRFIKFPTVLQSFSNHLASELLEKSSIDAIYAVGEDLPINAMIVTSNYLRPTLVEGKVVLLVERLYTGEFAPIEKENPHQCCGGAHAPY